MCFLVGLVCVALLCWFLVYLCSMFNASNLMGAVVKLLLHIILCIFAHLNHFLLLFFFVLPDNKEQLIALYLQSEMMSAAKEATKQKREAKKLLANAIASGEDVAGTLFLHYTVFYMVNCF